VCWDNITCIEPLGLLAAAHCCRHCNHCCLLPTAAARCCPLQVIDIDYVNEAMKRMEKGDVHFRFVIDINKSLHL
jgi:hypothetical protein